MSKHVVIYSHGFGVKKDDRGLLVDIANSMPEVEHVMFDYNDVDEANNTLTVSPINKQVTMLTDVFEKAKKNSPEAIIDLVCHSQGCIIGALADLPVRKTLLLTPPIHMVASEDKFKDYVERRPGTVVEDGNMIMPRRDGSTTIISEDYWRSYDELPDLPNLYNKLAKNTDLAVVDAGEDEVLGEKSYDNFSNDITIVRIAGADHNFKDQYREGLIETVKGIIE